MVREADHRCKDNNEEERTMTMMQEFKEFAMRGNMVDMAVGIVVGAAFGSVVSSFVEQVLTPPLGLLIGGVDFRDLAVTLRAATPEEPAVTLGYGVFLQSLFDFIIIAFAIFLVIKVINRLKRKQEEQPAEPPKAPQEQILLTEIRDLLKARNA
jgi:large conductance mechanosensitive channel